MILEVDIRPIKFKKEYKILYNQMCVQETPETAIVTFKKDDGSIDKTIEYGYKSPEIIQREVEIGGVLRLDYLYLDYLDVRDKTLGALSATGSILNNTCFFHTVFNGMVDFTDATFYLKADFGAATFVMDTSFSNVFFNASANFWHTTFMNIVGFDNATFCIDAEFRMGRFSDYVSFQNVQFIGIAQFRSVKYMQTTDFTKSKFCSTVYFDGAKFSDKADFTGVTFMDKASFIKVEFEKEAVCNETNFYDIATYNGATFTGDVSFYSANFYKASLFADTSFYSKADYRRAIFHERAAFWRVIFNGDVDFYDVSINVAITFITVVFSSYSRLVFSECNSIILENCTFVKTVDVFSGLRLNSLFIANCKNLGLLSLPYNLSIKKALYNSQHSYESLALAFNFLKVNYNRNGEYDYEDQAYVEYRRCVRKTRNCFVRALEWPFLDLMSCYCTKPFRVFGAALIAIAFFAGLYFIPGIVTFLSTNPPICSSVFLQQLWNTLYHSTITFFTIGYGNSVPSGWWGLLLTGLEGFIGVFLMSLFTVTFVRKVLR